MGPTVPLDDPESGHDAPPAPKRRRRAKASAAEQLEEGEIDPDAPHVPPPPNEDSAQAAAAARPWARIDLDQRTEVNLLHAGVEQNVVIGDRLWVPVVHEARARASAPPPAAAWQLRPPINDRGPPIAAAFCYMPFDFQTSRVALAGGRMARRVRRAAAQVRVRGARRRAPPHTYMRDGGGGVGR